VGQVKKGKRKEGANSFNASQSTGIGSKNYYFFPLEFRQVSLFIFQIPGFSLIIQVFDALPSFSSNL